MSVKLSEIKFTAGAAQGNKGLSIKPGSTVILVGPNNSGKSLALREIEALCCGEHAKKIVVDNVDITFPSTADEVVGLVKQFETPPPEGHVIAPDHFWVGQHIFSAQGNERTLHLKEVNLRNAHNQKQLEQLKKWVSALFTTRLDGRTRFFLTDPKDAGDLQLHSKNHLMALFKDDISRERVRELTEKAFGLHFVIDPTAMTKLRIRMSTNKPKSRQQEQALDQEARDYHRQAEEISALSDGVQAYVGLVSAVMSLNHKILLIDEPEAFLHPPLSRRLGADLTKIAKERDATLVLSTHSAPFVMGCVESSDDITIVRLTYEKSIASARMLDPAQLKDILKNALLRSTGVIQGLFHRAVIVGESDVDRAFYDEINRRLLIENRGVPDALFLNAQNMHTVHRLVAPLRMLGIPAIAIVDLDFLTQTGTNWSQLLNACQIPTSERANIEAERDYFKDVFSKLPSTKSGKQAIKDGGIINLAAADKPRLQKLLDMLSGYGLFMPECGEIESWLIKLNVSGHGPEWLINIFNAIGDTDDAKNFLKPEQDDVWKFIDKIAGWVNNPSKKGIPS